MSGTDAEVDLQAVQQWTAIEQFCSFTGSNEETARATLEACCFNVELAINMHVDSVETSEAATRSAPAATNRVENPPTEAPNTINSTSNYLPTSSSMLGEDVRPPIPPVRQVLVEDVYSDERMRRIRPTVFDAFRDFRAEARWMEQAQDDDPENPASEHKKQTLQDLFRPPLDLMFRGSMDAAREEGNKTNKWLMVNIQNVQEFSCQVLNRDVWSNIAVKSIIKDNFIFWQIYHDSNEGRRYMQFYNVTHFPYVAILDPRTGEKLRSWTTLDSVTFCDCVTEFLQEHPSPSGASYSISASRTTPTSTGQSAASTSSSSSIANQTRRRSFYDESEEMQLEAAIAASLQDTSHKGAAANHLSDKCSYDDECSDELETFDSDNEENVTGSKSQESTSTTTTTTSKSDKVDESVSPSSTVHATTNNQEDWKTYLGPEDGQNSQLVIRFPDGNREQVTFPASSQLKVLFLYVQSRGYSMAMYDLVTNFPLKNLKQLPQSETLLNVGLFPRETVFVQLV